MAKNERKLTPAEQKRKEQFALVCEEMERQGYRKTDLTIGVVKANLLALIVMLPFAVLSGAVVLSSYSLRSMIKSPITSLVLLFLFLALLLLTAVHEGIHALTWAMFGKDYWKSIRFGVIWKALTPYCTCLRPAKRGQYILGAAMPTLVLGIGLTAAAALTGVYWVFILAIAMIFGGGGDFTIILKILGSAERKPYTTTTPTNAALSYLKKIDPISQKRPCRITGAFVLKSEFIQEILQFRGGDGAGLDILSRQL